VEENKLENFHLAFLRDRKFGTTPDSDRLTFKRYGSGTMLAGNSKKDLTH
jgi:hypothetical protein